MFGDVFSNRASLDVSERILRPEAPPDSLECGSIGVSPANTGVSAPVYPSGVAHSTPPPGFQSSSLTTQGRGIPIIRDSSPGEPQRGVAYSAASSDDIMFSDAADDRPMTTSEDGTRTSVDSERLVYQLDEDGVVSSVVQHGTTDNIWRQTGFDLQDPVWDFKRKHGINWSPWSRLPVEGEEEWQLSRQDFWCWALDDEGWWIGFCYLIGSLLFVLGSGAALFTRVADSAVLDRDLELLPYGFGGVFFTVGTVLLIRSTYCSRVLIISDSKLREAVSPLDSSQPLLDESMEREVAIRQKSKHFLGHPGWKLRPAVGEGSLDEPQPLSNVLSINPTSSAEDLAAYNYEAAVAAANLNLSVKEAWTKRRYWLDLVGAIILFIGVQNYNVMVAVSLWQGLCHAPHHCPVNTKWASFWLVRVQSVAGGACFCIAGYLYWVSTHRSWSVLVWQPDSLAWWISVFNMFGSLGFLFTGAVPYDVMGGALADVFVGNAPELFVGFFIGSLFYSAQSHLMIVEIAVARRIRGASYLS